MLILGTDGEKMSKSRDNFIDIFLPEKELKDIINKKIITDATALEDPKDPNSSTVYALYQLVATSQKAQEMRAKLLAGGYGWGHAKKDLLEAILTRFSKERELFNQYTNNTNELDKILEEGAEKARRVAKATLSRVRGACGY
jgi:tryptophanyl-tRNA synthetase